MRVENISNIYKLISVPFHPACLIHRIVFQLFLPLPFDIYNVRVSIYIRFLPYIAQNRRGTRLYPTATCQLYQCVGGRKLCRKGVRTKNPYIRTICRPEISGHTTSKVRYYRYVYAI